MNELELQHLKDSKVVVYVDVKQKKPFHYAGIVLQVSDSMLTLLDKKTNSQMTWPLSAIVAITRLESDHK
jgi:hypothetical protein